MLQSKIKFSYLWNKEKLIYKLYDILTQNKLVCSNNIHYFRKASN